jgi:hypothetical protein
MILKNVEINKHVEIQKHVEIIKGINLDPNNLTQRMINMNLKILKKKMAKLDNPALKIMITIRVVREIIQETIEICDDW